jgi:hypothetical protein
VVLALDRPRPGRPVKRILVGMDLAARAFRWHYERSIIVQRLANGGFHVNRS